MMTSISQLGLLTIIASSLILVSSCTSPSDFFNALPSAVYFTTNDDDKYVNDFEKLGALVATSFEELTTAFHEYPELQALYIGENSLDDLDMGWVKEMYKEGILIAAINEPTSVLGNVVSLHPDLPDIDFSYAPEGFIVVTAFQSLSGPTSSGYYAVSDYFATIEDAVKAITRKGEEFYPSPERVKES